MTNIKELAVARKDMFMVDPQALRQREGWNVRDDTPELREHIETIANSISKIGFLQDKPLVVYQENGDFWVSDGHCRLNATLLAIKNGADIKSVPVVVEPRGSNEADRIAGILTRNGGKKLEPLEQGRVYKRLQALGWTDKQIVDATGRSISHVKHIFSLMESSPETQQLVATGQVSAAVVVKEVRKVGPAVAQRVIAKAVKTAKVNGKKKATVRTVERASRQEVPDQSRTDTEVMDFFRGFLDAGDGVSELRMLSKLIMQYQSGKLSEDEFRGQLSLLLME